MLEALYKLSEFVESLGGLDFELSNLEAKHVIVICFDSDLKYINVEYEEFKGDDVKKYLYKRRASNSPSYFPTLILTDLEKSLKNLGTILNNILEHTKEEYFNKIKIEIEENKKNILEEINSKLRGIKEEEKKRTILTIKIDGKYIGEIDKFIDAISMVIKEEDRYLETKGFGICSICGEKKEVSGDISPYTFYTIDKPGFIVGGFNRASSWKNFPLCLECKNKIDRARNYVERNFNYSFTQNIRYYLIPDFMTNNKSFIQNVINILNKSNKEISVDQKSSNRLTSDEEELQTIREIAKEDDILTVNFLFMKKQQSREEIKLLLNDIYPSRLRCIFSIKEMVDKEISKLSIGEVFYVNMGKIEEYFFSNRHNGLSNTFGKEFYKLTESIFKGIKFDQKLLIRIMMFAIRYKFRNKDFSFDESHGEDSNEKNKKFEVDFLYLVRYAYFTYVFVKLCTEGGSFMIDLSNLDNFLGSLKFLDTDLKKGIFLTGALVARLLEYQQEERDSKPFLSKLSGLRLSQRNIKRVFYQARNKLEEYEEFKPIDSIIYERAAYFFAKESDNWKLSIDDISFYFAVGMGLYEKVYSAIKENNKEDKEV